jgi:hypothetical protein
MGTLWVRKSVGLGQISAYRPGQQKGNNFFSFSALFVRQCPMKFDMFWV